MRFRAPSLTAHQIRHRLTAVHRRSVAGALGSCTLKDMATAPGGCQPALPRLHAPRALQSKVDTIVVIYAENRAFDNLYGNFPGARGLSEVIDRSGQPLPAYRPQVDRDGTVLPVLPPTWGGVTAAGCHARWSPNSKASACRMRLIPSSMALRASRRSRCRPPP